MGRPKFTVDQIIAALRAKRGMVYLAARALQCDAKTIYNAMRRHPEILAARDEQRGQMVDAAESSLHKLILEGNVSATIFFLKTQGRDRGYIEKTEQTGVNLNVTPRELAKLEDAELDALISRATAATGRT